MINSKAIKSKTNSTAYAFQQTLYLKYFLKSILLSTKSSLSTIHTVLCLLK